MRLFYASGSPYARIVRVALRELGLTARVEEVEVTLRDPNSALLPYNPGGKVPALQLDNGTVINESLLVLAYLDTQHAGRKLLPMDGSDGWKALSELGRAYAFLDAVTVWNRELRFGQKAPGVIALERERADRAADALEAALVGGGYAGPLDAAQIVLAAALENFARRHKVWDWRSGRPKLSAFLDRIAARPSFSETIQPEIDL
ncbi:MAG: glutathione S-transferase family protein [Alphaproteobacteria bacterium]|nr:glutathione S-transferase family protein [Alphaproteobacteria bacterium]MBV9551752.1 glutathione S-transferase family protein [Alphaproteobacteria bacterium]